MIIINNSTNNNSDNNNDDNNLVKTEEIEDNRSGDYNPQMCRSTGSLS